MRSSENTVGDVLLIYQKEYPERVRDGYWHVCGRRETHEGLKVKKSEYQLSNSTVPRE